MFSFLASTLEARLVVADVLPSSTQVAGLFWSSPFRQARSSLPILSTTGARNTAAWTNKLKETPPADHIPAHGVYSLIRRPGPSSWRVSSAPPTPHTQGSYWETLCYI